MILFIWQEKSLSKAALWQNDRLVEYKQRSTNSIGGYNDIFLGKVTTILDKGGTAFVELGHQQAMLQQNDCPFPLQPGLVLMVQVEKPSDIYGKQAKLTAKIKLPGIHSVYCPHHQGITFSSRSGASEEARTLIQTAMQPMINSLSGGLIIRHALAASLLPHALAEVAWLHRQWQIFLEKCNSLKNPQLVFREEQPFWQLLRDEINQIQKIIAFSPLKAQQIQTYLEKYYPSLQDNIEELPIADWPVGLEDIQDQLEDALRQEVTLPSGGSLIIEEGQTLTAIDINAGKNLSAVQQKNYSKNFYVNQEALGEVAKQIRLRNLSGHILIDVIPLSSGVEKKELLDYLSGQIQQDSAYCRVAGYSRLGLIELTRQNKGTPLSAINIKQK